MAGRASKLLISLVLASVGLTALMASCTTTYPRRDPTGEVFPTVVGTALTGDEVRFPDVGRGEPLLLIVGYQQDSQFDIDRWLLGITDARLDVRFFELPTIPGLLPRMFSGTIDGGMRKGIPREDWGGVVTLYGDAAAVARFTGNAEALPGRVLLLDASGRVVFFHDRGYSVGVLKRLQAALAKLRA